MSELLTQVGSCLTQVISWFGSVLTAMIGDGSLAPLFGFLAIGFAITIFFAAVKVIRSFIWGA